MDLEQRIDQFYDDWESAMLSFCWPLKKMVLDRGFDLNCVNISHTPITRERVYTILPRITDIEIKGEFWI